MMILSHSIKLWNEKLEQQTAMFMHSAKLAAMGEMNVNVIRTYTIHPPHFYGALAEYNRAHPTRLLRLMHGVWAELPPEDDFNDPIWKGEFTAEIVGEP